MGLGVSSLVTAKLGLVPTAAFAADVYRVVRLASWDDLPAQSIYMSPYEFAVNTAEVVCTGDYKWISPSVVTDTDVSRTRKLSGTCRFTYRDRAVDVDGSSLDVVLEVMSCTLFAWPGVSAPAGSRQFVFRGDVSPAVASKSGQLSVDDEPYGTNHNCNPMSITFRIRLLRKDGSLAYGRLMFAARDVDINCSYNDDYSESIRLVSGFDPEIYVLDSSWLLIDTSVGRVHENYQGTNYASNPNETFTAVATPDFQFEWRGHQCGTVLFDSVASDITIPVRKVWEGGETVRPGAVTVRLSGTDGSRRSLTLNAGNGWAGSFDDLPLVTAAQTGISYTLSEDTVDGFETDIEGNAANGYAVTNRYVVPKMDVPVEKVWVDGEDVRPGSVTVRLHGSDGSEQAVTLTAANGWRGVFKDVPERNGDGSVITYTLSEDAMDGFDSGVTGAASGGFTVTNTYVVPLMDVPVSKTWAERGSDMWRPGSVTVRLRGTDGSERVMTLTAASGWSGVFEDVPVTTRRGSAIAYELVEDAVANYDTSVSGDAEGGFVVTNTLRTGFTDFDKSARNGVWL